MNVILKQAKHNHRTNLTNPSNNKLPMISLRKQQLQKK